MQDIDINVALDEVEEEFEEEESPRSGRFYGKMPLIGKISYIVFLLTVLLVPLFILPSSWGIQLEFLKKLIFSGGILLSFALWLVTRLEDGRIVFPGGAIFWTGLSVIISFLVSSILSPSVSTSLLGLGNENDTFVAIIIFFISMFLSATLLDSMERLSRFFLGIITGALVAGVVELVQIFSPWKFLSGGILANTVGKWNDLGVFFGLSLLLSLISLELQPFYVRGLKKTLWFLFSISLLLIAVVNYDLIWGVVGIFGLIVLIYSLAHSGMFGPQEGLDAEDEEADYPRRGRGFKGIISRPSFMVVILSLIFFFNSANVGSVLGKYGIYQLEVRPSWQSTVEVAKTTMQKSLLFGSGPNTFATEWASSKPDAVNSTVFWNTDFNVGFGRLPSFAVTLGLFGLITSGLFLISLLYYGLKSLLASFDSLSDHFIILASCVASFYLWSFSIFYVTDTVILVLTFVVTGIFLSSLARAGLIRTYEFSFLNSPRLGFVSVLAIVLLILSVLSGGYLLTRKFGALYSFQQGLYNFNNSGNLQEAELAIKKAISLDEQDLYYRSLAEIYMINLRNIMNGPSSLPKETLLAALQNNLSAAAGSARRATEVNAANYLNWMTLGKVGETVLPLKDVIAGSYDLAVASYNKALALNPKNPNIYLSFAQLEAARGNVAQAKEYINQALSKKSNFTAALFLQSQIEASQGNLPAAIAKVEQAAVFSPGDVGVLFQIGLLKYMNKNYSGAVDALKAATDIQPNYSNAKYFLGLSYSKIGQTANAIKEFEDISALNPDSEEVKTILKNLRAGRGALESIVAVPPKNETQKEPEKRKKLPVKEQGDSDN